jgi:hypothetical protein
MGEWTEVASAKRAVRGVLLVSDSSVFRLSIVTVRFFLLLVAILQLCKSHAKAGSSHEGGQ